MSCNAQPSCYCCFTVTNNHTATEHQAMNAPAKKAAAPKAVPAKKARTVKHLEDVLVARGQALVAPLAAIAPVLVAMLGAKAKPAKARKASAKPQATPAPSTPANVAVAPLSAAPALYTMPSGVVTRPGTRKAAVYDAMCALGPTTRAELIAAAEAAEQAWRGDTKRLEAAKPGAKWFRRFAPSIV